MFDLVPLAGAGMEMTYFDFQSGLVAQFLEFHFPKTVAATVAAAAVGGDQQARRVRMPTPSQPPPPTANRCDGELGRVAADSYTLPRFVMLQIIHPVRYGFALFRVGKVMHAHFGRSSFGLPSLPGILQISQGFLLLGIHRNRRLPSPSLRLNTPIDVPKLGVSIRMALALARLAVRLQTITGLLQQLPHRGRANRMPLRGQLARQTPRTFAGPPQRRLGIATAFWFDQLLQGGFQSWIGCHSFLAAGSCTTLTPLLQRLLRVKLRETAADRRACQPRRFTHCGDPAISQRLRFHSRPTSSSPFCEFTTKALKLVANPFNNTLIRHSQTMRSPASQRQCQFGALIYARFLMRRIERAALERGKLAEVVVAIQFAECGVDQVVAVAHVAVGIIAILEAIRRGAGCRVDPPL